MAGIQLNERLLQVRYTFFLFLFSIIWNTAAQVTTVSGKVTEARTGAPIPFANVVFSNTTDGAITDFEGNFTATTSENVDSIEVRYIGFITQRKAIRPDRSQQITFQLEEDVQTLGEVIVYAGENPAWPIMRNVIRAKSENDKRSLEAYDYEAYTKIEVDVDNISGLLRKSFLMKKVSGVLDSVDQITGEDGLPVYPIFISEAISRIYYRKDPFLRHEHIEKTKLSGIGITDGTTTSQVIGSTLQEYNFYQNWLNIVSKEFVSPIADGWKLYYDYDLVDSLYIGGDYCYRIDFYPKNEQDLAFQGTMWITKEEYALRRIDAAVSQTANLNFVDKLKIQQDLFKTSAGPWIPEKSRVVVDISRMVPETAGFIAKFYSSSKDVKINDPRPTDFYLNPVSMDEEMTLSDETYWENHRHDSLTQEEIVVSKMIDTLKSIPIVKAATDAGRFALSGYWKAGPLDLGPYPVFYGDNSVEGVRVGFGARTNFQFSKKMTLGGYAGYGFEDKRWKGRIYMDYILSRKKWSTLTYEYQKEIDQIWLLTQNISQNSLFYSLSRFGNLTQPFLFEKHRFRFSGQIGVGWNQSVEFRRQSYNPQFDFSFNSEPGDPNSSQSAFQISEVTLSTHFARDEIFVIDDNRRVSMGTIRWPSIDFSYTYGIPDFLGSDIEYHKFELQIQKRQKMGFLGVGYFDLDAGWILGDVPYPVLFNTIGNETIVYANFAYNLMNFFEFSSDKYASLRYRHSFEGLLLNKIPLMRKLKWRLTGTANIVYGGMSNDNLNLVNYPQDEDGNDIIPFRTLSEKPYIELGYGVENIFKFFRIDAFHRITYLNSPDVNKFGLKLTVQVIL